MTYARQGCVLVPDGARAATARICSISSLSTGLGKKALIDRLDVIAWSTFRCDWVSIICFSCDYGELLLDLALGHLLKAGAVLYSVGYRDDFKHKVLH